MDKKSLRKALFLLGFVLLPSIALIIFLRSFQGYVPLPTLSENKLILEDVYDKDSVLVDSDSLFYHQVSLIHPVVATDSLKLIAPNLGAIYSTVFQKFQGYPDFQIVSLVPWDLKPTFDSAFSHMPAVDLSHWKVVYLNRENLVNSLKTWTAETPKPWYVNIMDKDQKLRGREDNGIPQKSYNSLLIKVLRKDVGDDLKVLISEYSLAFKKYDKYKEK